MIPLSTAPNLIDQVYDRVVEAITDNSLAPGQPIRQQELAERLGVSRQPVSHALHLLHRQGLVTEIGRKGFQVTALQPERIRHLYEVRSALDAMAARLAAGRGAEDPQGLAELALALRAGEHVDPATPLAELIALDVGFHHAVYRLSGNPVIEESLAPLWPHMRRSMASVLAPKARLHDIWSEHEAIGACIFAGDAEGAAQAASRHALNAGRATEDRLNAAGAGTRDTVPDTWNVKLKHL